MLKNCKFVDLTHHLTSSVPTWTGSCGFSHEIKMDYDQGLRVLSYRMQAGVGTHMDSPSHFFKDTDNIGDIPLENLIVPVYIVNLAEKMEPDLQVMPKDIEAFEKKYEKIPRGSLVVAYTGWQRFWKETLKYRNPDENDIMHFPSFHKASAELLVERGVAGIGIDTLSPDRPNEGFPVHKAILGNGKYIIENLTNLEKMPPAGAWIIALPIKVKEGTEAAVRAVGIIPK